MKTIKYEDIKTATTVDEFRENLRKYFVTANDTNELVCGDYKVAHINDLNSMSDLYDLGISHITPTIKLNVKDITQPEIIKNMLSRDFTSVLQDDSRFPIYEIESDEDGSEYVEKHDPMFYSLDNQILRSFYIKTLGDFSGYVTKESESA